MAETGSSKVSTIVFQSSAEPPPGWVRRCMESVQGWCDTHGFKHGYIHDEDFFRPLPDWLKEKAAGRGPVLADVARLIWARRLLTKAERVIWLDADVLIFDPERFITPDHPFVFGQEYWVQEGKNERLEVRRNVHNAFCQFSRNNPFLDFYLDAAFRMLSKVQGDSFPNQFVGPKFLSAQNNIIGLPLHQRVGMVSPHLAPDLIAGGGPGLDAYREASAPQLYAANLCSSLERPEGEMEALVNALLSEGWPE